MKEAFFVASQFMGISFWTINSWDGQNLVKIEEVQQVARPVERAKELGLEIDPMDEILP
jgi:hypothetical protein